MSNDRERNFFARLEHEGVSAGEREREHPHRHHRGKIEWRDADADAERLQHRLAIDAAREILERVAHEQRRNAAGVFDVFDSAIDAAARFGQRLAVFARNALRRCDRNFLRLIAGSGRTSARVRPAACRARRERHRPPLRLRHRHLLLHSGTSAMISPRDGLKTGDVLNAGDLVPFAADECRTSLHHYALTTRERVGLFHEIVAAPFAVRLAPSSSPRRRQRRLSVSLCVRVCMRTSSAWVVK